MAGVPQTPRHPCRSWPTPLDLAATHAGASLERLSLEGTGIDDRGCRRLASALPALTELVLGGAKAVGDSGFRALCSLPKVGGAPRRMHVHRLRRLRPGQLTKPYGHFPAPSPLQLESLRIMGAAVSDPGLLSSLPRCPTLRHLTLASCWLCSEAGLQSAAAAAVQANGRLAEVVRDGASLPLPPIGAAPDRAQPSPAGSRATARMPSASRPTLSAHELQHDERLSYSTEELLELSDAAALLSNPATAAAVRQLRARLPADLRSPRTGGA